MRLLNLIKFFLLLMPLSFWAALSADNQTQDLSPILSVKELPFRVKIETVKNKDGSPFLIADGIQSYAFATYGDKILLLNGRLNGMHGFNDDPNNFPPLAQNRKIYVVDVKKKSVASRSLTDPESGLTLDQIDSLSVTASQFYQKNKKLYITGGYGFRNSIGDYTTFDILTAIDIPRLIHWVIHPQKKGKASDFIRQISDEIFRVTGGAMFQLGQKDPTLLVFGQDFEGTYFFGSHTQVYTRQVRKFQIHDDGKQLSAKILSSTAVDENYRRRDLNIVPMIKRKSQGKALKYGLVALSGVFTVDDGLWTVPVTISSKGKLAMADPEDKSTFKQGMNNYASAFLSLYSRKTDDNYTVLLGGITYEYFEKGVLQQDSEFPFTNEVTTVKLDKKGNFSQYIMDAKYPNIKSTGSNPGNRLLFGASSYFIPAFGLEKLQFKEDIFNLDRIVKSKVVGYIIGGIASTLMNTEVMSDSTASPYIFKVIVEPNS